MRLLLIEDDPEIGQLLLRYLGKQGFHVTHVSDGATGVDAFAAAAAGNTPFHVVLTDGLLPRKNGYEVAKAIRATPAGATVGIAMVSAAFRGASAKAHAHQSGIDVFFAKPFVLTELREKIRELARRAGAEVPPSHGSPTTPSPHRAVSPEAEKHPSSPPTPPPPLANPAGPAPPAASPPSSPSSAFTATPATSGEGHTGEGTSRPRPVHLPSTIVGGRHRVESPIDAARLLLSASREGLSGLLRFTDAESVLQLAFLNGVVVGAVDNLREHNLGDWLHRQGRLTDAQLVALNHRLQRTKERVAEALVALEMVTAAEALTLCELQAARRLRRSLLWRGDADFNADADTASRLAVGAIDLIGALLQFGLEETERPAAVDFIAHHRRDALQRTADFDAGLVGLARVRPRSLLPQQLLQGPRSVGELFDGAAHLVSNDNSNLNGGLDVSELYAMWLAGLVRLPTDPPADTRPVARAVSSGRRQGGASHPLVARLSALLLKARGASFYDLLDLPRTSSSTDVVAALAGLESEVGRDACASVPLGDAADAARELWTLLDEGRFIFSDEHLRRAYDDALQERSAGPALGANSSKSGNVVAAATLMLSHGEVPQARAVLEPWFTANPDDVEAAALRGHLAILSGDRQEGIKQLMHAARQHPQAVKPMFYLALLAHADGDAARARALLDECVRRAPEDKDVLVALSALP